MLPSLRSMLTAMVATTILVTPIGIAVIPAPSDSYPHSAGFPRVGEPVPPQELEQNLKRQAFARRAAELNKLLALAEPSASRTTETSSAASDRLDGRTPPVTTPTARRGDAADGGPSVSAVPLASQQHPACTDVQRSVTGLEAKNANAPPETRPTEAAQAEPAIEPTIVIPRAKPAHLHTRRRIKLTRSGTASSDAPSAVAQSTPDPYTGAFPVAPRPSAAGRGSAF